MVLEAQLKVPFDDELTSAGDPCLAGATAAYGCEVDRVLRLRGVYGIEIQNNLEAYATAGFVIARFSLQSQLRYRLQIFANQPLTQQKFYAQREQRCRRISPASKVSLQRILIDHTILHDNPDSVDPTVTRFGVKIL